MNMKRIRSPTKTMFNWKNSIDKQQTTVYNTYCKQKLIQKGVIL